MQNMRSNGYTRTQGSGAPQLSLRKNSLASSAYFGLPSQEYCHATETLW
jgi:hypothetical protein